jgi:hypothetical protein
MEESRERWRAVLGVSGFLLLLGILEYVLFFRDLRHFFQGDTIYLFVQRASSLPAFLREFVSLGQSGWYRPLGHGLVPFLFFPWFGLEPTGYRIVTFILFFAVTVAEFGLVMQLTRSRVASVVATIFFACHTVNVYTTYDVAFTPELLYTFFYICSVLAYCRSTVTHRRRFLAISVLCFIASLFSKEAAVTLPATLVMVETLRSTGAPILGRFRNAVTSVGWHLLVLAAYLTFVVGYLRLESESIATLFKTPETPKAGYALVLDRSNFSRNIDHALSWAFNVPRGWTTQFGELAQPSRYFLKGFRFVMLVLAGAMLFDRRRRPWLLVGVSWFLLTLTPMISLRDHFLPYYLLLPLAGFSMVIGGAADRLHEYLARFSLATANGVCTSLFVPLLLVSASIVGAEAPRNGLLGRSSEIAENSLADLKALYPALKERTTLFVLNDDAPDLWWHQASGGLFRLHYGHEPLQVSYSSKGELILPDAGTNGIVLRHENGHLRDVTGEFRSQPSQFDRYVAHYGEGSGKMVIEPREVVAGDSYVLTIAELADTEISIHYVLNGGPVESFTTRLDSNGSARFYVSSHTRKGFYRFVGFNLPESSESRRSNATIIVR